MSNGNGNPPLYIPAFNVAAGEERALAISDPLNGFSGNVFVTSTLQLWGLELNGAFNMLRMSGWEFTLLTGFRLTS